MAQMSAALIPKEAKIKALDHHIEILRAKLSFLIKSYDYSCTDLSLYQYEIKINTVKQEIREAIEQRPKLNAMMMMKMSI